MFLQRPGFPGKTASLRAPYRSMQISVTPNPHSKLSEVDFAQLEFGKYMSDHMMTAHYIGGAWKEEAIVPFGPLTLMPTILALHYGQSVFEGLKAFRMHDGRISIFRIARHHERLQRTLKRMCMPEVPFELFEQGLVQLVRKDAAWVPNDKGCSLYIRPLLFATEERFGVKISDEYLMVIMTGPVPPFYPKPLRVKVEDHYRRAADGGTGGAKCAGNYGGAFYASQMAKQEGFDQVLWTDLSPELYIEESGTMNVFFRFGDTLVTPPLGDTILDGVTRDSLITLARESGITVEERRISANELVEASAKGVLKEAFGAGTAAVTAPIAAIGIKGKVIELPAIIDSHYSALLRDKLTAIRLGTAPDTYGWNTIV